jgi:peptidoglycan/xylan/chitin deacetylase (PgdA/CDA1 family)
LSARAVYTVTFDNLGEVTDLQRGLWPEGEPLGRHFSATRALPRILALLEELGLHATFFVEGLNTELYPGALAEIAAAGHEVAYHGWCHEDWGELDRGREDALLERGVNAMDELGVRPVGFRPPGGRLTASSLGLLAALGFTHCSPAGSEAGVSHGVAVLPFEWPMVDAYHYLPRFSALRGHDRADSPARFGALLDGALADAVATGRHLTTVFHPFLTEPGERFDVMRRHLEAVRALVDAGTVRCAPYRDLR